MNIIFISRKSNKPLPIKTTELYPYYVPNLSLKQSPNPAIPSYPIRFHLQLECFPQMRPEASQQSAVDSLQSYAERGIPEEWVEVLKQLGYTTIEKLKEIEKPGKLANDLNGYNKKNKLGLKGLSPEEVVSWFNV